MRFERLDLNLLVALDVLIEDRSVSAAARRLNLSQPALSGALNRLREYFDDELLISSGRTMVLTEKGKGLRDPVREALQLIRAKIITPRVFDPAASDRQFTIAASDYAFNVLLSDVLQQMAVRAPGITCEIMPTDRLSTERLERGEIDLMLTISTHMSNVHPRLELWEDDHVIVCWSQGAFGNGLTMEEFLGAGHVVAYFGSARYPAFTETYIASQGFERRIAVRLPNFTALPQAVVGTDRVAIMYRRHAEYFSRFLPLTIHQPPLDLPPITEEVQWHSSRNSDTGLRWLVDLMREQIRQTDPQ